MSLASEIMADSPWGYWRGLGYTPGQVGSVLADASGLGHTMQLWNGGIAPANGYPKPGPSIVPSDPSSVSMDFIPDSNFWSPVGWINADWSGHSWAISTRVVPRAGSLTSINRYVFGTSNWGLGVAWTGTKHVWRAYVTRQGSAYVALGTTPIVAGTQYQLGAIYGQSGNVPPGGAPTTFIAVYVGGVQEAILDNLGSGEFDSPAQLPAMAQFANANDAYDGLIAEFAIYNHYVNPARMAAHNAAAMGSGGGGLVNTTLKNLTPGATYKAFYAAKASAYVAQLMQVPGAAVASGAADATGVLTLDLPVGSELILQGPDGYGKRVLNSTTKGGPP